MKILFLSYYFEPDLSAGSFRNSSLLKVLVNSVPKNTLINVITTHPNRYNTYKVEAESLEKISAFSTIHRIKIPTYNNGMIGQVKSFIRFYFAAIKIAKNEKYDLVYASSSKLFTAFLASRIAKKHNAKLYLDIRDIFKETIIDVFDNSFLKHIFNTTFGFVENYTFKKANHINLVSEGFKSYFNKYNNCTYSYFTNGIDAVFLEDQKQFIKEKTEKKIILYAGNIGEGQGMDIIIPPLAKALAHDYQFVIIGDGGAKKRLIHKIEESNLSNVKILNPMNRKSLLAYYNNADFFFIHLNILKAFERVLPSKLFEYGAFNKPIIAGVEGYAVEFLEEKMSNIILFKPGDYKDLVSKLKNYQYTTKRRMKFRETYSRKNINVKMAESIVNLL